MPLSSTGNISSWLLFACSLMTPHNLHCTAQSPAVLVASFSGHIMLWTDCTAAAAQPQQTSLRGSKITSAALVALPGRTSHGSQLAAIFGTQQGEVYGLVADAVTGEMGQLKMLQPAEKGGGLVREPAETLPLACSLAPTKLRYAPLSSERQAAVTLHMLQIFGRVKAQPVVRVHACPPGADGFVQILVVRPGTIKHCKVGAAAASPARPWQALLAMLVPS